MTNTTNDVTDEDKTAALCAATDYCRQSITQVGIPIDEDSTAEAELAALESIRDEALAGWYEGRELADALSDDDMHRAQRALWTSREKSLDDGDIEQAAAAEMVLRDLAPDPDRNSEE